MGKNAFEILAAGSPFDRIIKERQAQDAKWGEQNHPDEWWLAILMEEIGELAEAVLETRFGGPHGGVAKIRREAVQSAAVLVAFLERMDRDDEQQRYALAMEDGQI